jgi:hypothetical protein
MNNLTKGILSYSRRGFSAAASQDVVQLSSNLRLAVKEIVEEQTKGHVTYSTGLGVLTVLGALVYAVHGDAVNRITAVRITAAGDMKDVRSDIKDVKTDIKDVKVNIKQMGHTLERKYDELARKYDELASEVREIRLILQVRVANQRSQSVMWLLTSPASSSYLLIRRTCDMIQTA